MGCIGIINIMKYHLFIPPASTKLKARLDLNFQGHLSRWTGEIENSPILDEMTPVSAIVYVIIFLIIDLSCRTSVIMVQPVRGAIFQNFHLSGTVRQSLRSSPGKGGIPVSLCSTVCPSSVDIIMSALYLPQ